MTLRSSLAAMALSVSACRPGTEPPDTEPPRTVLDPLPGYTAEASVMASGNVSDDRCASEAGFLANGAPVASFRLACPGGKVQTPVPLVEGPNVVTLEGRDAANNASADTGQVVRDTAPPELHLPADMVVEAAGPEGVVVSFTVSATDTLDPAPVVECTPPSGSTFPLTQGDQPSVVLCTATDAAGNGVGLSFNVEVHDTIGPSVSLDPLPAQTALGTLTVTGTVYDAVGLASVRLLDHGAVVAGPLAPAGDGMVSATIALAEGSNNLVLEATDLAGNVGSATATVYFGLILPSKVERQLVLTPDVAVITMLGAPAIPPAFAAAGFTAVVTPGVRGARHDEFLIPGVALEAVLPVFLRTCTDSAGRPCDPTVSPNSCDYRKCGHGALFEPQGVGVVPGVTFFTGITADNHPAYRCDSTKPGCPTGSTCSEACMIDWPGGFDWWDDTYWAGIFATLRAMGRYACEGPLPQKAIHMDQEVYWGHYSVINSEGWQSSWNQLAAGKTHADRARQALQRGRQAARALAEACPGIEVFVYNPDNDFARAAWLAGLASPEVGASESYDIKRVSFWANVYYRTATDTTLQETIEAARSATWGLLETSLGDLGLSAEEHATLIQPRAAVAAWGITNFERTYYSACCAGGQPVADLFLAERNVQFSNVRVPWFDAAPEATEEEAEAMKLLLHTMAVYPGTFDYLCFTGSEACPAGKVARRWLDLATYSYDFTCGGATFPKGTPSCYAPVTDHFSLAELEERTGRVADAIAGVRQPARFPAIAGDALAPAAPRFDAPSRSDDTWPVGELEVRKLDPPWVRKALDSGAPEYVLEAVVPNKSDAGLQPREARVFTYGAERGLDIDGADVEVRVEVQVDRTASPPVDRLVFEGAEISLGDLPDGWHEVRVARRFLPGRRSAWSFHAPPPGHATRIRRVRFNRLDLGTRTEWTGLDIQEWLSGRGWSREAGGALRFDPAATLPELPYSAEIIALPGRPTSPSYKVCVRVRPQGGAARLTYRVPATAVGPGEIEVGDARWLLLNAQVIPTYDRLKRLQWRLVFKPLLGTAPFAIEAVRFVDKNATACPP